MRRTTSSVVTAVAVALVVAACSGDATPTATEEPTGAPTTAPATDPPAEETTTGTPSPTASATGAGEDDDDDRDDATAGPADETDDPEVAYSTDPQNDPSWPSSGGELLPVDVRAGVHEGFERVVFDFEGTGTPGWRVEYVDVAVQDPRGTEVDVDGDAVVQVIATGVRIPEESEYDLVLGSGEVDVEGTEEVEEVYVSGIFEGQTQAFIGLESELPFRVFTLTDPSRLVVDFSTE